MSDSVSPESPKADTLAEAADDLCLLAEHDRLVTKAWALDIDELRDLVTHTGVAGRWRSRLLRQLDELRIARAALAAHDQQCEPEPPDCECGHDKGWHSYFWDDGPEDGPSCDSEDCTCGAYEPGASDTPEGGELENLLTEADQCFDEPSSYHDDPRDLVGRLASALRHQSGETT